MSADQAVCEECAHCINQFEQLLLWWFGSSHIKAETHIHYCQLDRLDQRRPLGLILLGSSLANAGTRFNPHLAATTFSAWLAARQIESPWVQIKDWSQGQRGRHSTPVLDHWALTVC